MEILVLLLKNPMDEKTHRETNQHDQKQNLPGGSTLFMLNKFSVALLILSVMYRPTLKMTK